LRGGKEVKTMRTGGEIVSREVQGGQVLENRKKKKKRIEDKKGKPANWLLCPLRTW